MIPFNKPLITGLEEKYISDVLKGARHCGDGPYTKKCNTWLEKNTGCKKAFLTTSCTHALEMASILIDIQAGDEVIMPSFTFVSSANPFVLRGAKVIFIDINPNSMNMDENLVEQAITEKTKAIVPVHYAGTCCNMDKIMEIASKHNLYIIEDAAQALMATYKGKALGTIGDIGCISFHETKNYHCGEGGAILVNNEKLVERAEIIREKGTNRSLFLRGQVDKYTWVDVGSSYLPGELNAAFLFGQLEMAEGVNLKRRAFWSRYYENLKPLKEEGLLDLQLIPEECSHNAHLFYIKMKNIEERQDMIDYLRQNDVQSVFHYVPLHSAIAGLRFSEFKGEDKFTTMESERLLRLPLFYDLKFEEVDFICNKVERFLNEKSKKTKLFC